MTQQRLGAWALGVSVVLCLGCGSEEEPVVGTFSYKCLTVEDAACGGVSDIDAAMGLPAAVGAGANFLVEYESPEPDTLFGIKVPSHRRAMELGDGSLLLLDGGTHTLMAQDLISEEVHDLVHVTAHVVADVFVSHEAGIESAPVAAVDVSGANPVELFARPVNAASAVLAGTYVYVWEAPEDGGVASIAPAMDGLDTHVTLTPVGNGNTTMTVSVGRDANVDNALMTTTLSVRVQGMP